MKYNSNKNINNIVKNQEKLKKPSWIKIKPPIDLKQINNIKKIIHKYKLHSVCQEASCPNLPECFNQGTVTFMILGSICTRKCPFCDVSHGRTTKPDTEEPKKISKAITEIGIHHVVLTSVTRDDLHDGGAQHFVNCINAIRKTNPSITIEILVPDFRNSMQYALKLINNSLPDIFNHNIESVPRLYNIIRPGGNYNTSLKLLQEFKKNNTNIPTKSGIMLGLGETKKEIFNVLYDLKKCGVTMITIGQYLQPSIYHLNVKKYITLKEFEEIKLHALSLGFTSVYCGPFVRSSYHANLQIKKLNLNNEYKKQL